MLVGVSSACCYPMETEQAIDALLHNGIKTLEIFFNSYQELQPEFLLPLKEKIQQHGAKVAAIHPFTSAFEHMLFFSNYERRVEDGLLLYRHFFRAAQELGAPLFVLHGSKDTNVSSMTAEQYAQRYARIFSLGEEYGVITAQENVVRFQCQSPQFIRQLRDILQDRIWFVLDCKQCRRAGIPVTEMAGVMGDKLLHLHLSDETPELDCALPGTGSFDFAALREFVDAHCPNVQSAVLELYRQAFSTTEQLAQGQEYLSRFFA